MKHLFSFLSVALFLSIFTITSCEKASIGSDSASLSSSAIGTSTFAVPGSGGNTPPPTGGVLTAGEWNDFDNWSFWKTLMLNDTFNIYQSKWGFNATEKWQFVVKDANAQLLPNAVVEIKNGTNILWTGRTNKYGSLQIIPSILNGTNITNANYTISYSNTPIATGVLAANNPIINITVPNAITTPTNVDIMLIVDATGSMGDEITYLKNELLDVLNRADNQITGEMRFSSIFYRDFGDDYVTKASPFTTTKATIVNFVSAQSAGGGGDTPEAVEEALKTAMQQSWSTNAKAKIIFLITDAPSHETPEILTTLKNQIRDAASRGIMIIPVTASGIDKSSEFLYRFMAQATNSTYTFLTNNSGIGNNHITPTVGNYQVEFLNNLMVRLITKYGGN
jgi:von Willebrand factor type A domain